MQTYAAVTTTARARAQAPLCKPPTAASPGRAGGGCGFVAYASGGGDSIGVDADTGAGGADGANGPQRRIDDDGVARSRGEFLKRHGREEGRRRWKAALQAACATVATQGAVVRAFRSAAC